MKTGHYSGPAGGQSGYTLLEVVVAMTILTIGLLAVASMQTTSIRGNVTAGSRAEGMTWAQDRVEDLMALPYDAIPMGTTNDWEDEYMISSTVSSVSGVPNVRRLTVRVTWFNPGGEKQTELTCVKPDL